MPASCGDCQAAEEHRLASITISWEGAKRPPAIIAALITRSTPHALTRFRAHRTAHARTSRGQPFPRPEPRHRHQVRVRGTGARAGAVGDAGDSRIGARRAFAAFVLPAG